MRKMGRPRIHENEADRRRKKRLTEKEEGKKAINVVLEPEHKALFNTFCRDMDMPQARAIGYLLECAYDRELPDLVKHDSDSESEPTEKS